MYSQARAAATRRKIIDASVALFRESGFSGTNLNKIIRKAEITPGAFYYHFDSKDAVAFAIIDEVASRMTNLRTAYLEVPGSGVEKVIDVTYQLSVMLSQDESYWVAAYLEHTMARHSRQGIVAVADRIEMFIASMARAIRPSELRAGISPEAAARTMFTVVYGCLVMTDLVPGDLQTRFAECWKILLPGVVAQESVSYFEDVLQSTVNRYRQREFGSA